MKITSIVIISFVLLTAAITVGDAGQRPVSPAVIRAADCCDRVSADLPSAASSTTLELKGRAKVS